VEPGEAEQIPTWSGYGQISDWVSYETEVKDLLAAYDRFRDRGAKKSR
jgi:hypothetical protein